jgi:hypothetical protein
VSTAGLPDGLLRYLEIRDRQHAEHVGRPLAAMTERERGLVREAAVMGFVRGTRFGGVHGRGDDLPSDSQILAGVIGACLAMPDLYPVMDYVTDQQGDST